MTNCNISNYPPILDYTLIVSTDPQLSEPEREPERSLETAWFGPQFMDLPAKEDHWQSPASSYMVHPVREDPWQSPSSSYMDHPVREDPWQSPSSSHMDHPVREDHWISSASPHRRLQDREDHLKAPTYSNALQHSNRPQYSLHTSLHTVPSYG